MGLGILLFVFGLALTTVVSDDACPSVSSEYAYQKTFQGICYTFFKTRLSFGNAADVCIHLNGTLALPKTKEINDFLAATMRNDLPFNRRAWIGLSDADKENDFVWADGTRLRYPDDFNAFGANEGPSSSLGQLQDYVALDPSGSWHDYRNIVQLGYTAIVIHMKSFICEFGAQTVSTTQPTTQPMTTPLTAFNTRSSTLATTATTTPATTATRPPATTATTTQATGETRAPATTTTTTLATTATSTPRCRPTPLSVLCPELDCGLAGYRIHPGTGCYICACDV